MVIQKLPSETINILLRKDPKTGQTTANPNLSNNEGMSALAYALKTDNQEIVDKLCEVTTENIDSCQTCTKLHFLGTKNDQTIFGGLCSDQTNTNKTKYLKIKTNNIKQLQIILLSVSPKNNIKQ